MKEEWNEVKKAKEDAREKRISDVCAMTNKTQNRWNGLKKKY